MNGDVNNIEWKQTKYSLKGSKKKHQLPDNFFT